ncbi:hypothetical protein [Winogradskyella psychrotolerans]|uniref:hypothetical protein n=1 Tax=Winogradskyella psychrotolerans TaxID=1344585 RepID=UPI001C0754DB|nr:hypothetical protein [Winogradskyella psychrotolerans]MBU2929420.1 hypothetical protein [Winogradskyella psychrotolerans]
MENEFAKHEEDYLDIYESKGYTAGFHFKDGTLIGNDSSHTYTPKDIHIVAEHRYEGMSNPSDMSILYIIETNKGEKGTMLIGYGPSANLELSEFFNSIPETQISDKANINLDD